ncbi:MAG: 50S ribosomal protein L9 [Elusimicrobia bacterium CG08_land_8_20_14_0_20_44_26]|nr:MAG: 50S ribosomal protein L9 [Elusimicrobia bacterium CG08_land_8_20_14_0_20_44_26]
MKVILAKNVANLGDIGAIKEVAEGFARNYLIPRGFAYMASENSVKQVEKIRLKYIEKKGRILQKAQALAQKISEMELNIARSAHDENKLFGSVGESEIAGALKEKGIELDRKQIELSTPIKELGIYEVKVKLHPEVTAALKVWVTPKE